MRRILLVLPVLTLAACGTPASAPPPGSPATTTAPAVPASPGSPGTGLVGYTTADLLGTEALAQANSDTLSYNCAQTLYNIVATYTPPIGNGPIVVEPPLPTNASKGLAYKAEYARLLAKAALNAADSIKQGAITPAMRAAFAQGCGPLVLDFQMDQVRTVADLTSLMSALAKIP